MSQKVNPLAVRLRLNRHQDSSWFSDYYYSKLLYEDLNFREYLISIKQPTANKLGFRPSRSIIHFFPKKTRIHLFCLGRPHSSDNRKKKLGNSSLADLFLPKTKSHLVVSPMVMEGQNIPSLNRSSGLRTDHGSGVQIKGQPNSASWKESRIARNKKAIANSIRNCDNFVALRDAEHFPFPRTKYLSFLATMHEGLTTTSGISTNHTKELNGTEYTTLVRNLLGIYDIQSVPGFVEKPSLQDLRDRVMTPYGMSKAWKRHNFLRSLLLCMSGFTSLVLKDFSSQHKVDSKIKKKNPILRPTRPTVSQDSLVNLVGIYYFFLKSTNTLGQVPFQRPQGVTNKNGSIFCEEFVDFSKKEAGNIIGKGDFFYLSTIESILATKSNTSMNLRVLKIGSIYQSANLIAQEIACKLEQKKSFRSICRSIFQQITVCNYIKGIRISCSGRLNGAEIAKTECRKYGETSFHVFSDKIDYAQAKASTPYGILGIKVWISYV